MPNNVVALREQKGLSQERFAELCGISRASIARYEAGEAINRANAVKIAAACGVSVDFVLGIDESEDGSSLPQIPITTEARILAAGIDRMPESDRKRALGIMEMVFERYKDYFERADDDGT